MSQFPGERPEVVICVVAVCIMLKVQSRNVVLYYCKDVCNIEHSFDVSQVQSQCETAHNNLSYH